MGVWEHWHPNDCVAGRLEDIAPEKLDMGTWDGAWPARCAYLEPLLDWARNSRRAARARAGASGARFRLHKFTMGNFGEFAKLVQRPNMVQPEPYTMVDVVGADGVLGTRAARKQRAPHRH